MHPDTAPLTQQVKADLLLGYLPGEGDQGPDQRTKYGLGWTPCPGLGFVPFGEARKGLANGHLATYFSKGEVRFAVGVWNLH